MITVLPPPPADVTESALNSWWDTFRRHTDPGPMGNAVQLPFVATIAFAYDKEHTTIETLSITTGQNRMSRILPSPVPAGSFRFCPECNPITILVDGSPDSKPTRTATQTPSVHGTSTHTEHHGTELTSSKSYTTRDIATVDSISDLIPKSTYTTILTTSPRAAKSSTTRHDLDASSAQLATRESNPPLRNLPTHTPRCKQLSSVEPETKLGSSCPSVSASRTGLNAGLIVGIVIACLLVLFTVAGGLLCWRRRTRRTQCHTSYEDNGDLIGESHSVGLCDRETPAKLEEQPSNRAQPDKKYPGLTDARRIQQAMSYSTFSGARTTRSSSSTWARGVEQKRDRALERVEALIDVLTLGEKEKK